MSKIKKEGDVTPMVIPAKEQSEPISSVIVEKRSSKEVAGGDSQTIRERAAKLGVEVDSDDLGKIAISLIDKLTSVDEELAPLAQSVERDERVGDLLSSLLQGNTLEEALLECGVVVRGEKMKRDNDLEHSLVEAEKFCAHHNLEHSVVECFVKFAEELIADLSEGKITQHLLSSLWKGFVYDKDMKESFDAGVLNGRNAKIEELRGEREEGDGMGNAAAGAVIDKTPEVLGYIERVMRGRK